MHCPRCRVENPEGASACSRCGAALSPGPAPGPASPEDTLARIIPFRNPAAVVAWYLGLAGLIPLVGVPMAVGALALGIVGLAAFRRNPQVRGAYHAWAGLVLAVLSLVGHAALLVGYFWLRGPLESF